MVRIASTLLLIVGVLSACAEGGRRTGPGGGSANTIPDIDAGAQDPPVFVPPDPGEGPVDDGGTTGTDGGVVQPPPSGYDIVAVSATVEGTKVNGDNWDFGGDPPDVTFDLYYAAGTKTAFPSVLNSFTPYWNETIATAVGAADLGTIEIHMFDLDADELFPSAPDKIGRCAYNVDQAALGGQAVTVNCPRDNMDPDQSGFTLTLRFDPAK
ncbi:MAG: hypothetical protein KC416_02765 [Myxococcales bacterium]|nr:hypothetical protein [Myxococcales bacterium]